MLNSHQLCALATFLDGLTQLTKQTGVNVGGHMRPMVEIDDEYLTIDVQRTGDGEVTYALDLDQR